jgi:UDP-N-acetylmuramoyl-tripeptide--D-alanyl-D-alanine ligase
MLVLIVLLAIPATLVAAWHTWQRLRFHLHMFQLEGYKLNEFSPWLVGRGSRTLIHGAHLGGAVLVALGWMAALFGAGIVAAILVPIAWLVAFASAKPYRRTRTKKPLVYTDRMKRLIFGVGLVLLLPVVAAVFLAFGVPLYEGAMWYFTGLLVANLGVPLWVLLGGLMMQPIEQSIQRGFKHRARRRLESRPDMKVVGITGSYGKTSTKFVVGELLSQRFNTLVTPSSYNTPMGLCLVINEKLRPEHQVAVMEMGIRYPGDMRHLCEIVRPDIAVITTIGIAHLESMGSKEEIAREKGSMISFLKEGGQTVLNVDDPLVAKMAQMAPGRVWRVSVEGSPEADITASGIRYGPEGATFTVRDDTGGEAEFRTRLLGQHNVLNILLGVAVGRALGLRLRQMARAVQRVEPVEHRLQLKKDGPVTVIDDAFNSNPTGARNAVDILGQFNGGRRVIVTPGMIELGARQEEENRIFGEHIAGNVDLAILIGERQTKPIRRGLADAGFPEENLRVFGSLFEAQAFLKSYLREGDVVLYENDLPDQYAE